MDILEEMMQKMLETHTPKRSSGCLTSRDTCPFCKGTGWEMAIEGGYEVYRECRCGIRQKHIMDSRLSFANIPETFKDMRIQSFDVTAYEDDRSQSKAANIIKAVFYWLDDFDRMQERGMGLYLYSSMKGSGKTRMAASVANELMYGRKIRVKFATSLQILSEIKASWDKRSRENGESEDKLLEHLSQAEVLVIDDFGTEAPKDWIGERFYQIINNRYIDRKITIFTSNYSLDKLQYDERITNRIKERAYQIPFPEESVREIAARKNARELINGIKGRQHQ